MITFESNNYCEHCGERLNEQFDNITIREGQVFHTECLPENCKE